MLLYVSIKCFHESFQNLGTNGSKQNDSIFSSNPVAFATRHANGMIHACQVYMHMLVPIVPTHIIIIFIITNLIKLFHLDII